MTQLKKDYANGIPHIHTLYKEININILITLLCFFFQAVMQEQNDNDVAQDCITLRASTFSVRKKVHHGLSKL